MVTEMKKKRPPNSSKNEMLIFLPARRPLQLSEDHQKASGSGGLIKDYTSNDGQLCHKPYSFLVCRIH